MRRAVFALVLLTGAVPLTAAEAQKADYSRDTILRILHDRDQEQAPFKIDIGMLQIHTRNARFRLAWLPFLAPLPYSYPRTTQEVPNPFVLTGTDIPYVPPKRDGEH